MHVTHMPTACGSSSKAGLSAGPFIQTSSLAISSQIHTGASGSVAGYCRNMSSAGDTTDNCNFYLLFGSHIGAATKTLCCVRDWEAVIFTLKTDFVAIFNTCVNSRLEYCIMLYKDKMRDAKLDIFSVNI